jgi:NAD(P)H-dependent FMN reductase
MAKKKILFISSSMKDDGESRSRFVLDVLYNYCKKDFEDSKDFNFKYVDIRELKDMEDTTKFNINTADALVIASPVHNWTVSAELMEYINVNLDDENVKPYKPMMTILGAGSTNSLFANEALNRSLITVANAIVVGKPIVVTEKVEDLAKGETLPIELEKRLIDKFHILANITRCLD